MFMANTRRPSSARYYVSMSKPKTADVGITVHLDDATVAEIDARRRAAIQGTPGATFSRAGYVKAALLKQLADDATSKKRKA